MKKFTFILCLIICQTVVFAQSFDNKIDSLAQTIFKDTNAPGCVIMVSKNGKAIYHKAFGLANIELNTAMQTQQVFQLGSMTKQFTAVAILMLAEQQKLNIDDPLSKYISDYPNGKNITIHHLLTHTAGIKDYTKMRALSDIAEKDLTPKQLIDFFKNEPSEFAPGEKFFYNNSGYVILGHLIELISGKTYEDFIQTNIFKKAGMLNSRFASDVAVIKNRAYGYRKSETAYINKNKISFNIAYAAGALMSSSTDLLIWQNALNQNLLLKAESLNKAFTKYKLNDGEGFNYGYGWHLKEINGETSREHGGSIFGFKTMAVFLPKQNIYVVALSNCDCNSPTELARQIANAALKYL